MADPKPAACVPDQRFSFLLIYTLAVAGGVVAYMPFLTILLPIRVTQIAGAQDISWIAYISLCGAIAASLANIAFGWLSDLTRTRRGWIMAGVAGSCAALLAVPYAADLTQLVVVIVVWQCATNLMLSPLAAMAGDFVPDHQKGLLGGMLAAAPALGAMSGVLVTMPGLADADGRLVMVATLVAVMVLPVVWIAKPKAMPDLMMPSPAAIQHPRRQIGLGGPVVSMWSARLLIQIAEAALFAYLLFWLRGIDPAMDDSFTARLFGTVLCIAVPLALLAGRWSDRISRPILPLAVCGAFSAAGLLVMAFADSQHAAITGYVLFSLPAAILLSLHTAQTLRVLPDPATRGRDLGVFNLTNTVPAMIMPWLTLMLVPVFGFSALFMLLAVLAIVATALLANLSRGFAGNKQPGA